MSEPLRGLVAVYAEPGAAAQAARRLRAAGHPDVRATMPAPFPEVLRALGRPKSPLGRLTATGAALGFFAGLALTSGTALSWPLQVGGKPVVALPPFMVIVFELSVLFGALTNFSCLMYFAFRGRKERPVPHDPRFLRDRIGLFIPGDATGAEALLGGAEEVRRVG